MIEPHFIFPTPIATVENTNFSANEHTNLINLEYLPASSNEYLVTKDMNVLDSVPILKEWIMEHLKVYALNSLATDQELKFTQSWCLKHLPNTIQTVVSHSHPNSIISGAYYVDSAVGTSSLKFHKDNQSFSAPTIDWIKKKELQKDRHWTWEAYEIPAVTGRLILFPSYINHSVGAKEINSNTRCVLSFNTWFSGPIGENAYRLGEIL